MNNIPISKGHHPFRVPEGYFDHFADEFMAQLPTPAATSIQPSWWHRYRYVVATAACICGLLFGGIAYMGYTQDQQASHLAEQHAIDASLDEMTDYVMYDNGDMYASLSE